MVRAHVFVRVARTIHKGDQFESQSDHLPNNHSTQRHGRLTREQPALLPSPFPGSWASSQAHLGSLGETGRRGEVGGQDERPGLGLASQIAPPAPDEKSRRGDGAPPVPSRRAPGNRPAFAVCSATDDASSQSMRAVTLTASTYLCPHYNKNKAKLAPSLYAD
ncbi:hypothetical protein NUW58_g2839 [Xylaria curta]|uniref:Uncharacterized protein n=1 Tax=Xylaria curta TaxID=42375 RepID=A0ACC1PFA5_9PEZI|nr:hypothetical protein NUW58_g2839 [Xylaria curta]